MMGRIDNQMQLLILDLDSMIPENHLLRQIKNSVNFDFIYEKASSFYSHTGRKSIDPVVMIKMLLIGYLYGIKSERRLEEEVSLNLAYRWFCELDLMQKIPDHSTFSQNRRRRFRDNTLFRDIFNEIIMQCINMGIVSGNTVVADGSFLPGNVWIDVKININSGGFFYGTKKKNGSRTQSVHQQLVGTLSTKGCSGYPGHAERPVRRNAARYVRS